MRTSVREASYKLSLMQQGMLFHHQLGPGSGVNIEQIVCSLPEDLAVDAFKRAWNFVISRHQALRTGFQWEGIDEPMQHVYSGIDLPFELHDWAHLSADNQTIELEEYLKLDRKKGFDLKDAPLMRIALFHRGKANYCAVWTFHHIIADGRSHPLVLNEVFAAYDAFSNATDLRLPQPGQYQKFISWLGQQDHSRSESFWRNLLSGFTAPTPVDAIPKAVAPYDDHEEETGEQEIVISESVLSSLHAIAKKHHLTVNTFVQGSWSLLLSRYSGEQDVVFGAVRACRRDTVEDADSTVGLFINTLPVRTRISTGLNVLSWLRELREQNRAIREHEHTPLVQILGYSDVRHGMPLFESILIFDNYQLNTRLRSQGGKWQSREFRLIEKTGLPLSLYAYADERLLLKLSYDKKRFDDATIRQILGSLKTLLEGMAERIDRPIASLPILTEQETKQLLREWNDTQTTYSREKCVHDLFEDQVKRTPDAAALVFEDVQLTYKQLNGRANKLARYLQKLGVGPETRVGIYMERSHEMMVGLLAIHKAGGAYLPLDHTYPSERIAFMLEDAQAPVILTHSRLLEMLPENTAKAVCVDTEANAISTEAEENLEGRATPDNMCYLIYTSGSTGKPKGVMVCHKNVVNFFVGMDDRIPYQPQGTLLAVTSISFDIHVLELFWTLARGFKVVLFADKSRSPEPTAAHENKEAETPRLSNTKDGAEQYSVPALIGRHNVTHFQCTPSLASIMLGDKEARDSLRSVRTFLVGGEALPAALASQLQEVVPGQVINMYGPTETTIWSTTYSVSTEQSTIPIGRPISNTEIYILDNSMIPVPVGVIGELFIGGEGVTRGYLNRPELTAERFIVNPFSDKAGARIYRTGDLARYRPDGNIEYLGRIDNQVKLHGFRIELGEIETLLEKNPAVRQAVVMAREDVPGDKQLAAYIVPEGGHVPSVNVLRQELKEKLPDYMVPNSFMVLEKFPLTPNGKTDRRALPSPTGLRPDLESVYVAPRSEIEQTITSIWRGVLHLEKIGMNDNFFDLGGHSLRMAQVHGRLREKLHRDLSMLDLFKYPTIHSLSNYLSREKNSEEPTPMNDRAEKLKEGKSRLKQRFKKRGLPVPQERASRDE